MLLMIGESKSKDMKDERSKENRSWNWPLFCKRHFQKSCLPVLAFLVFYQLFNIFIVVWLFVIVFLVWLSTCMPFLSNCSSNSLWIYECFFLHFIFLLVVSKLSEIVNSPLNLWLWSEMTFTSQLGFENLVHNVCLYQIAWEY